MSARKNVGARDLRGQLAELRPPVLPCEACGGAHGLREFDPDGGPWICADCRAPLKLGRVQAGPS